MSGNTFASLIHAARKRMRHSHDPVHDLGHAERTAHYMERLSRETGVNTEHTKSLIIAAWWHDVSRTMTDKPSFIIMPFVDDLLSAVILWWHSVKTKSLSRTTILAVCLIACKSMGTGALLTKILIRKQHRVLVDLLEDADTLDVFTVDRVSKVLVLTESSRVYRLGYRIHCRWYSLLRHIKMKTQAARKYVLELLQKFLAWITQPAMVAWHVRQFGETWAKKSRRRFERVIRQLTREAASATV
jgi:hypothetical protein